MRRVLTAVVLGMVLVSMVAQSAMAGRVGGEGRQADRAGSRSSVEYSVRFWAHEPAVVLVSGDGDTDLDLFVYDDRGNLVASDTDRSDDCAVRFWPSRTQTYTVVVKNLGNVYNDFVILTN